MKFINRVKQLFLNQPYLKLYPIAAKPTNEQNSIIEALNNCDPNDESESTILLTSLYNYTSNKLKSTKIDKDSIERNIDYSYKTKKKKKKNKETGEKEIEKVKTQKRGTKRIIERFQRLNDENDKNTERYEDLLKAMENGSISNKHIPLIDQLLIENKYKEWIYKFLIITIISVPILIFILSKIFNI